MQIGCIQKLIINLKKVYFLCKVWNYPSDDATLLLLYTETNYWQRPVWKWGKLFWQLFQILKSHFRRNSSRIIKSLSIYIHAKAPWSMTFYLFCTHHPIVHTDNFNTLFKCGNESVINFMFSMYVSIIPSHNREKKITDNCFFCFKSLAILHLQITVRAISSCGHGTKAVIQNHNSINEWRIRMFRPTDMDPRTKGVIRRPRIVSITW